MLNNPLTEGLLGILQKVETGEAALWWIIIEVPHRSYKQVQCVSGVTQLKSDLKHLWIVEQTGSPMACKVQAMGI